MAANYVTASRFALSVVLVALVYIDTHAARVGALAVVGLSGFTDFVDGQVARRSQPTPSGAILDPMADTFALLTGFACLLYRGLLPLWFFALALWSRAIFSLVRMLSLAVGESYAAPQWTTKVKAAVLYAGQAALFTGYAFGDEIAWTGGTGVRYTAIAAMTLAIVVAVIDFVLLTHRRVVTDLFRSPTATDD